MKMMDLAKDFEEEQLIVRVLKLGDNEGKLAKVRKTEVNQ